MNNDDKRDTARETFAIENFRRSSYCPEELGVTVTFNGFQGYELTMRDAEWRLFIAAVSAELDKALEAA